MLRLQRLQSLNLLLVAKKTYSGRCHRHNLAVQLGHYNFAPIIAAVSQVRTSIAFTKFATVPKGCHLFRYVLVLTALRHEDNQHSGRRPAGLQQANP